MGSDADSPTARSLRALALIQDHPGITAAALGDRLGVSDRAARRYVAILRAADIPVESIAGPYGGYQIGRGFRPPPLTFTMSEALGLTMAAVESRHGGADGAGRALDKLTRVLPAPLAQAVDGVRSLAAVPPPGPEVDAAVVADLVDAVARRRTARIRYRTSHSFEARVDPWGLLPRRGHWYLLCWSHERDARRLYRIDRVTSVTVLDTEFEVPEDLDVPTAVEEHLSEGWGLRVDVEIDAPVEHAALWIPRQLGRLEAIDERRTRLLGSTSTPDWYAVKLAEIGAPFRIVSPPELAHEVRQLGDRLRAAAEG